MAVLTPGLTIVKTASAPPPSPGTTSGYTITITDTGQTPYTGATLTDSLAGLTDDAAYNDNATTTTGTLAYSQAHPDLDREPRRQRHRHHHLHRHGQQPRHRRQGHHQHRHLRRHRLHLPPGHRNPLRPPGRRS